MKKVAVIGGGISGLAVAYYLHKTNPAFEIQIFEASTRVGGILETAHSGQVLMECGPDAFISEKPWALELCRELGMENEIISTRSEFRRSFILSNGKLQAVPAGFYLTIPKNLTALKNLPGMSWPGKLRMLADLFIPAKKEDRDESIADFVCRRFGREALEKLAQPMIAGIYTSRPENLSLLATFPKFREMERQHGSLIRAMSVTREISPESGPRYSLFLSLRNGMETLIEKLQMLLSEKIQLSSSVKKIERRMKGWGVQTGWSSYEADAVCIATPSYEAGRMIQETFPSLAVQLSAIRFEPVATLNFLFHRKDVKHPLDGFGFVVPAIEKRGLIGCSFSHQKFEGRVLDSDQVLLRAFVGGAYGHEMFKKSDEEMINHTLGELREILGISAVPLKIHLKRYPHGMPQYEVGHLDRVKRIFETAQQEPGLFLVGNSYSGIGIPDCIHNAKITAAKIAAYLECSGVENQIRQEMN